MQVDTTTIARRRHGVAHDLGRGRARQRLGADPDRPGGRLQVGRQPGDAGRRAARTASTRAATSTPVVHYGHGYGVAVAQGKLEGGLATNWHNHGYGWTGFGAPGDSGSAVLTASGQAMGDFTHLIVDTGAYPGSTWPAPASRRRCRSSASRW